MGGGGETTVTPAPKSAEELELVRKQIELSEFQLTELRKQSEFQDELRERFGPELERFEALAPERAELEAAQLEFARETLPIQRELLDLELEDIRRGGAASPEQIEAIQAAVREAEASGAIDIERFQTQATERLREELAPALGLRPTDAPILDRGAIIAREATRQGGQLTRELREAEVTARLNFPLAAGQVQGARVGFQQRLGQSVLEFQNQLREAAFLNRLRLTGQTGSLGLNLATGSGGNLAGVLGSFGQGSTTRTSSGIGLSDIGTLAGGIGGLIGAVRSARALKENFGPVDEEAILAALMDVPIEYWNYREELDDGNRHVGPMAEDFHSKFKVGDDESIHPVDVLGVLAAAVKALARRVEDLEI